MKRKINKKSKIHINYKKMFFSLFIIIIIFIFLFIGIKNISRLLIKNIATNNDEPSEQISSEVAEDITINLVATGDIMCHSTNIKAAYNSQTKQYDFSPVFKNVKKYIEKADIAIRKS